MTRSSKSSVSVNKNPQFCAISGFALKEELFYVLEWCRENQYEGIELWGDVPFMYADIVSKMMLKKVDCITEGMEISVHGPMYGTNISAVNPGILKETVRQFDKIIGWAEFLPIKRIVIHPGKLPSLSKDIKERVLGIAVSGINKLQKRAAGAGAELILENIGLDRYDVDHEFRMFEYIIDNTGVGICLDVGHGNITGATAAIINKWPGKIKQVHVHGNNGKTDQHLPAGGGTADWNMIIKYMKKYSIPAVHEIHSDRQIERDMLNSRERVKILLGQK